MAVTVYIPTPFRALTGNVARVEAEAADVAALIAALEDRFPGIRERILDAKGAIHRHVNVYVNDRAVEDLDGPRTPLQDGDEVALIPAIAGGAFSRYLLNDACVFLKKPLVDGSLFRFEGQGAVFVPGQGCYRCVYPSPPPPGLVPSCQEAGILGVLCGIIGSIQGVEAIRLLLGIGEPLAGRLLFFDALTLEFRQVRFRRDPSCPVCGDAPTITDLIDYEIFCGVPAAQAVTR